MLQPKRVAAYREIWLRLKANGYDVIPLVSGKDHPFKGWPAMPNAPADIATWNGRAAGVRMFGGRLLVIDLDTRTERVRDALLAMLAARWPDFMARCLRRHSGAVKLALLGRCSETTARTMQSHSYYPDPVERDKEQKNQVEVFTRNTKKYVGVHGAHSPGRAYGYHGRSIEDVAEDDLPEFPADEVGALVDACDEVMAAMEGLYRHGPANTGKDGAVLYDLTPEMTFRLADDDTMTLAELEAYVKAHGRAEGYATLFDPATNSPDRVKANIGADGLSLWDTKTEISHHWASAKPVDPAAFAETLREAAAAHGVEMPIFPPNWRERYENGSPKASLHNARLAIEAGGFSASHDTFHNRLLIGGHGRPLPYCCGEVNDNRIAWLRGWVSRTFGRDFTEKHIRDAVIQMAIDNPFNPVTDMLAEAQANWDGVERLDRMACDYLGCADTVLNRACVRKTMIAAVARARTPGIKFDTILVLESPEGWNKSSAWAVLAGEGNFSDERIIGKDSREVVEQLAGIWIHENADLAGMRKAEVETVKAYASRVEDRARPAYGHFLIAQPRHSIEIGTTNNDEYLQSQTGNRRFWPMKLERRIDLHKLKAARLQLWGEAAAAQAAGETPVLDEALWGVAGIEQEARRVRDPWEAVLAEITAVVSGGPIGGVGYVGNGIVHEVGGEQRVATAVLYRHVLKVEGWQLHAGHAKRLADAMRALGWSSKQFKLEGKVVRGYVK